jgi:hypothetical protein
MTTESSNNSAQASQLRRMESSMEAINVRIARLAMGLGVALDRSDELQRVMSRPPLATVPNDRRRSAEHPGARTSYTVERRVAYQWEELRGLLVLRYGVETRCVDELGVAATRGLMAEAEGHLERDGFKPGADGVNLEQMFRDQT